MSFSAIRMLEKEMNRLQRGMVDGCFEEGHFEQGIMTLDQLRLQSTRPSSAHVRQLIYIALYPPPPKDTPKDKAILPMRKTQRQRPGISSPSKHLQGINRMRHQNNDIPSPDASEAAWTLLQILASSTNSPDALIRTVPCYPPTESELKNAPRLISADVFRHDTDREESDADIAKRSMALLDCKDCWSMLRANVVRRHDSPINSNDDPLVDEDEDEEASMSSDSTTTVIGEYSWHLLSWFILLFENDQRLVEESSSERFSVLLFSQIQPAPTNKNEPRFNVNPALDIVFACYNQPDLGRRDLGRRLMSLLVDLTSSRDFTPTLFLTSTSTRLQACSSDVISLFLSGLPCSRRGSAIKLAICDRFLMQSLRGNDNSSDTRIGTRAKPQARKPRPMMYGQLADSQSSQGSKSQSIVISEDSSSSCYSWSLPTAERVLQLLEPNSSTQPLMNFAQLTVLFHILLVFGYFVYGEGLSGKDAEGDARWIRAIQKKELQRNIERAFSDNKFTGQEKTRAETMKVLLLHMCTRWIEAN